MYRGQGASMGKVIEYPHRADASRHQEKRELEEGAAEAAKPFDPYAGGYPVPPLPGQEFTFTSRRALAGATVPGTAVSGTAVTATDVSEAISDQEAPEGNEHA